LLSTGLCGRIRLKPSDFRFKQERKLDGATKDEFLRKSSDPHSPESIEWGRAADFKRPTPVLKFFGLRSITRILCMSAFAVPGFHIEVINRCKLFITNILC